MSVTSLPTEQVRIPSEHGVCPLALSRNSQAGLPGRTPGKLTSWYTELTGVPASSEQRLFTETLSRPG
jgi:hypothetical protein